MSAQHAAHSVVGRIPRRGTDRLEDAAAWLLCSLGLLAVLAAIVGGVQVYGSGLERARQQAAERTPITAVLLADSPVLPAAGRNPAPPLVRAPVRWVGVDGIGRVGDALVTGGLASGTEVRAWAGRDGRLAPPPATHGAATVAALAVAALILLGAVILLVLAWLAVQRWIGVRNQVRWAREWTQLEPIWSGRAC